MTYQPQRFAGPDGTELVVLTAANFDRLQMLAEDGADAADADAVLARIDAGEGTMPTAVLTLMLDENLTPLAAWRRYRGFSQAALAARAGLSQVWVGRIEAGGGYGSRATRRKLAAALDAPEWALEEREQETVAPPKSPKAGTGGKYQPLREHLADQDAEQVTLGFAEIAALVGPLPKSASLHRAWWANHAGNTQAASWMGAHYLAEPDVPCRTVVFRRSR